MAYWSQRWVNGVIFVGQHESTEYDSLVAKKALSEGNNNVIRTAMRQFKVDEDEMMLTSVPATQKRRTRVSRSQIEADTSPGSKPATGLMLSICPVDLLLRLCSMSLGIHLSLSLLTFASLFTAP